jgi:hypothetical protein
MQDNISKDSEYQPGDIYDNLFGSGRNSYTRLAIEPDLLDTPLSKDDIRQDAIQRYTIYITAYIVTCQTNDMDSKKIIANFLWSDMYCQPLPILLMLCELVGIMPASYRKNDVIKAMRQHVFTQKERLRLALIDYMPHIPK